MTGARSVCGWVGLIWACSGALLGQSADPCLDALAQHDTELTRSLKAQHAEVMALQEQQRLPDALETIQDYAEYSEQALGRDSRITLAALNHEAQLIFRLGDHPRARDLQQTVVDISSRALGKEDLFTLTAESHLVHTLYWLGDLQEALTRMERVSDIRKRRLGDEHPDTITAYVKVTDLMQSLGRYQEANQRYEWVLDRSQQVFGEDHPQTLQIGSSLGLTLQYLGELHKAKDQFEAILNISRQRLGATHPTTLDVLGRLSTTLIELGNLQTAMEYQRQVVDSHMQTFGPHHQWTLAAKGNLVKALFSAGFLAETLELSKEVLDSERRQLGEDHPDTLASLNNIAVILQKLGDLQGAKRLFEKVLDIGPGVLGPEHPNLLLTSTHLATVHRALGNLETAKHLAEQTLVNRQRLQGLEHQDTLRAQANLADIELALGDLELATQNYDFIFKTRLRLFGEKHPDTLMASLGVSRARKALGDLEAAKALDTKSFQISQRILGPRHPDTLRIQANLADTYRQLSFPHEARNQYDDILLKRAQLRGEKAPPITEEEAHEFFGLGRTMLDLEEPVNAFRSFAQGLDALEAQTLRVDPAESVKSRYISNYGFAYKEAIDVGLDAGQPAFAFLILERYRTQSLLSLLRWSHSETTVNFPQSLRTELYQIARRYDGITKEQDRIYPEQNPELLAEQDKLRRRREVIQGEIIAARRANGDLPLPLEASEVQGLLDPGTLLLSFAIGDDASHLFALTRENLEVVSLDVTSDVLATQIERLRTLDLENEGDSGSRQALSQWLYQRLLAPVAPQIQAAQRVLILADGSLNFLPFASLTRPAPNDPRGWQYLAQWKPIHSVQSATVYAELLAQRKSTEDTTRPWLWVGFGNPAYPAVSDLDPSSLPDAVRSTAERGIWGGLTPLPHTEREIQGIAQLFPEDRIQPFLQHDANEDQARQILGQASIVHFAAHGLADPDYPMDSFLALSLNDGDTTEHNGLLQAWEIADQLRLDADLVVLSACVTALGPNRGGEGLISLSRAFQIAGARSVLASLWSVNDLSTSELMLRFYRHLRAGESKDRALQLAQLELMDGPVEVTLKDGSVVERDFSSPYHWAAFQLIGDWR